MSLGLANSAGWWLMPPRQRTNSMPTGQSFAIICASWPAPEGSRTGSSPRSPTAAASASCSDGAQGVVGTSWHGLEFDLELARNRNPPRLRLHPQHRGAAQRIGRRSKVHGEHHAAGDHVDRARKRLDAADGRHHAVGLVAARQRLDRKHHFRGAEQRILPQLDRHRAGVAGLAGYGHPHALLTDDPGDDAERPVLRFEHGALLDMHLHIGQRFVRLIERQRYRPGPCR